MERNERQQNWWNENRKIEKKKWHEKGGIGHTHAFNELHYANMHNIDVEQKEGGRNEK